MMKAYKFYILTVLSLLAGACGDSKEEPVTVTPPQQVKVESTLNQRVDSTEPIVFTGTLNDDADTRAITSTYDSRIVYGLDYHDDKAHFHDGMEDQGDLEISGFGVYGFYTGDNLIADATDVTEKEIVMLNQEVTYDDVNERWIYSPMRFWPASTGTMSFFAYAPYSSEVHPSIGTEGNGVNDDYSKQVSGPMKDAYTYNEGKSIILPTIGWTFANQQDVVWGMANESTTQDVFKQPHTLNGFPYKNIHRPSDGTLKWKFKHALARVKFSIANFKNIIESYDDVVPGIPKGTVSFTDQGVEYKVGQIGVDPIAVKYDKGTTENGYESRNGWYAFLYERDEALCHRIENLSEKTRKVVITDVKFKNLVTEATFKLDNTHYTTQSIDNTSDDSWWNNDYAWEPWWDNTSYNNYTIDTNLLNSKFYISQDKIDLYDGSSEPGHHDPDELFTDQFPNLGATSLPLVDTGDSNTEHYFLMVPYKYVENGNKNIEIEVHYKVISRYKLNGNYTWSKEARNAGNPPTPASGDYSLEGISGKDADPFTVKSTVKTDFEANHSYHVIIRLGAMMELMFEITDWDNNWDNYNHTNPGQDEESKPIDTPITVTIPDYE